MCSQAVVSVAFSVMIAGCSSKQTNYAVSRSESLVILVYSNSKQVRGVFSLHFRFSSLDRANH